MSPHAFIRSVRGLAVIGAAILLSTSAFAAVESSCPSPCLNPPKSALFMRDTGKINGNGYAAGVVGKLRKGVAKTIVRIDVSANVEVSTPLSRLLVFPQINSVDADTIGLFGNACDQNTSFFCSVSGTFWWDIDALEAAHPGKFIGHELNIVVAAGTFLAGGGLGDAYVLSVSATVVKKK
jgi:hypothetical protein